jgi:NAD(P)-dependent dehydrogenase (short-subunit alcohol dehydrogenase family)
VNAIDLDKLMAKAALDMLTRTSAEEMLEQDGILMTAVDTGWITDERPHPTKLRLAEEGFHAPLDLVDGAARVYDPIVRGELGEDLHGCFLKDYSPSNWQRRTSQLPQLVADDLPCRMTFRRAG